MAITQEVDAKRPARVVVLGASNVARSLATAVECARQVAGGPLDVIAAFGHGRSYGMRMPVLFRELPGIRECGLWDDLARRPAVATAAILTDIGNDLLYDVPPAQIAEWVAGCVQRLQQAGARVALTALPLCSVERLSPRAYLVFRSLLFPSCRIDHDTIMRRAHDLEGLLRSVAEEHGAGILEHRREWYGLDPIHIRRRCWRAAWTEWYQPWRADEAPPVPPSMPRWLYLQTRAPDRRWLFGREFRKTQPAGQLKDGTKLSFY